MTRNYLLHAFNYGVKLAEQDNAAKLQPPVESMMEDTPEQSHRFGGAMRRLLAAGTAAGVGSNLGSLTGHFIDNDRAAAASRLIGGIGGGALGLYSPGLGGALGGAGLGGRAGSWLGRNISQVITGDDASAKSNALGSVLGGLGGLVGGGYLGYHALKD